MKQAGRRETRPVSGMEMFHSWPRLHGSWGNFACAISRSSCAMCLSKMTLKGMCLARKADLRQLRPCLVGNTRCFTWEKAINQHEKTIMIPRQVCTHEYLLNLQLDISSWQWHKYFSFVLCGIKYRERERERERVVSSSSGHSHPRQKQRVPTLPPPSGFMSKLSRWIQKRPGQRSV